MAVGMDDLGLPLKREDDCPPYRHYAQGLVGRVQNQRSSQLAKSIGGPEPNLPTRGPEVPDLLCRSHRDLLLRFALDFVKPRRSKEQQDGSAPQHPGPDEGRLEAYALRNGSG